MANRTDPFAATVHGTNPQHLIEKITRSKIYSSMYWKEHCFALSAETVIDKCMNLKTVGGETAHGIAWRLFDSLVSPCGVLHTFSIFHAILNIWIALQTLKFAQERMVELATPASSCVSH